jgi:hypothetical protein
MKYIKEMGLLVFLLTFIATVSVWTSAKANCTGCGEDGHAVCLPEEGAMSEPEIVFAVCVFADGTLIDHKGADSMSDCLKTKRTVEKKWRDKAEETNTIEINNIEYEIDGEALAFMCDLVDANVHHYEDGSWEIINILGKHKSE